MEKFTTMARLLSHLGDQLISNTSVALLELIKNSYDAKSSFVNIIIDQKKRTMIVEDDGCGMTKDQIKDNYLVIGTNNRLLEKEDIGNYSSNHLNDFEKRSVPLGEKGLGRFATMKLAEKVVLLSKSEKNPNGALLLINWEKFSNISRKKLEDISVHLFDAPANKIQNPPCSKSFTKIKLYGLKDFYNTNIWDKKAFERFYMNNFMKYINPFHPNRGFQIRLEVLQSNGNYLRFTPTNIDKRLLNQSHYKLKGRITRQNLEAEYYIRGEDKKEHNGYLKHYINELDGNIPELKDDFGDIEFEFYFFNRRGDRLKEIKGYEKLADVRKLLDQYCGGVMIYRDNFRVLPYAEKGNDWLDTDKDSQFRSEGIRFNTLQTVGAIFISTLQNPNLKDQTNREGLINNRAFENLYIAIRAVLRLFRNQIYILYPKKSRNKGPVTTEDVSAALLPLSEKINNANVAITALNSLNISNNIIESNVQSVTSIFNELTNDYSRVQQSLNELENRVNEIENQQKLILDLAGIGLIAETASHEIRSYLGMLEGHFTDLIKVLPQNKGKISTMQNLTKSLDAIVSRLEVQSITRRRTKSKFLINNVILEIMNSKASLWKQNEQNQIQFNVNINEQLTIKANQGMLYQIFDNLINNSYYWLNKHVNEYKKVNPKINIVVSENGFVEFFDNGRGISVVDSKEIFEPFFSRSSIGRGLGLYIVSEIMAFHNAEIYLSDELNEYGNYFKFILDFSKCQV